jgi:hypothetical protein
MKVAINISDALLEQAKTVALRRSTSLTALIEEGLREVVRRDAGAAAIAAARCVDRRGGWLRQEFAGASWERLAEVAYKGHGA